MSVAGEAHDQILLSNEFSAVARNRLKRSIAHLWPCLSLTGLKRSKSMSCEA